MEFKLVVARVKEKLRGGWLLKGNTRNPSGDINVLYFVSVNINILVVILCYSFAKSFHLFKPGKQSIEPLHIIYYNCANLPLSKHTKFNLKKK